MAMHSHADVGSPYPGEPNLSGIRVLVVDDQEDSRELLATIFSQWGANVVQCDSVKSALQALESTAIHLLIADIAMPDADGYDLIARVRHLEDRRAAVPAIVVSAYARTKDRGRARAEGYDGYCAKPVHKHELAHVVTTALRTSQGPVCHSA
jgi:CheY-like chemotaxis protein